MNYAIEILLEQKTLIESELVHAEGEERTELERRLIDTANALNTLNLPIVSNRRELLIDLLDKLEKGGGNRFVSKEWIVDNHLQGN